VSYIYIFTSVCVCVCACCRCLLFYHTHTHIAKKTAVSFSPKSENLAKNPKNPKNYVDVDADCEGKGDADREGSRCGYGVIRGV
jgi:hypothetical protein